MGGSESRDAFREKLTTLENSVVYEDDEYWSSFFSTPLTLRDVFELISPEDVRRLRSEKQLNITNLFKRIVFCLKRHIEEISQSTGTYPNKDATTSILTCVRILTRVMPFMLEDPQDGFTRTLFWRPGGYVPAVQQEFQNQNLTEIREMENPDEQQTPSSAAKVDKERNTMTMGVEILACLQRLLFLKSFCCPASGVALAPDETLPRHKLDTRFIWKGGIGTSRELPTSHTNELLKNRVEVLRCILVCLSGTLYKTIEEYEHAPPIWLRVFTRGEFPYTANLFSSLMSFICSHNAIGMGVPYGGLFSSGNDESQLVHVALQLLAVLFDFNPSLYSPRHYHSHDSHSAQISSGASSKLSASSDSISRDTAGGRLLHADSTVGGQSSGYSGERQTDSELHCASREGSVSARNVYRSMFANIKKEIEIDFIFDSFVTLLETSVHARNSYLPRSQQNIPYSQELLLILWHLITTNSTFRRRTASRLNSTRLLVPILFLLLDASNVRTSEEALGDKATESGPSRVGVLHMCSFLLLVLSSERDFAVTLNESFTEKFPLSIPAFTGCHADLLVLVVHRVIVDNTSSPANDSLIDMLLTTLCNTSAYIKSFCLESCVKVLSLLQRFARRNWLFAAPYRYHDVFFLLDMINNVVQYQYEGNQRLVYSLLRQKDFFFELQHIQFPHNYLTTRKENVRKTKSNSISNGVTTNESDAPHGEPSADISRGGSLTDLAQEESNTAKSPVELHGGEGQWVPTEEWFLDWKSKIPIQTISRLIQCLLPTVEAECQEKGLIDQSEVLEFLHKTTLVGLLPVPHPIIIRNYQPNAYTSLWFTSYMWGLIFSESQSLLLHDWKKIKFIVINSRNSLSSGQRTSRKTSKHLPKDVKRVKAIDTPDAVISTDQQASVDANCEGLSNSRGD